MKAAAWAAKNGWEYGNVDGGVFAFFGRLAFYYDGKTLYVRVMTLKGFR